jgi:hypothetical protein
LLFIAYVIFMPFHQFFARYFFPMTVLGVIVGGTLAEALLRRAIEGLGHRSIPLVIGMIICFQLSQLAFAYTWRFSQPQEPFYELAQWIKRFTPPHVRIGAFNAGIIGYFSDRTVINLDGVVNAKALKALQDGRLLSYIIHNRITYVADWYGIDKQILKLSKMDKHQQYRFDLVCMVGKGAIYRLAKKE